MLPDGGGDGIGVGGGGGNLTTSMLTSSITCSGGLTAGSSTSSVPSSVPTNRVPLSNHETTAADSGSVAGGKLGSLAEESVSGSVSEDALASAAKSRMPESYHDAT
eukprot:jgi/Chrpa1/1899/Chrysochromulina_OHIO_Genome00012036-RA